METAKIKNLLNGQIVEVHKSTEHSSSSYGQPVWVDDEGNDYGQVGFPLLGFELLFKFTDDQYNEFKAFLVKLQDINWGLWPSTSTDSFCQNIKLI
jgi:hypothetical protein